MPAHEQLRSEHPPFGDKESGPYRRHHHHHRRSRRVRQKLKIPVLIAVGLVAALLAWYLVVAYLDDRALGPTSHRVAQTLRASG